ncbi:MAG: hypothetical protein ACOY0T_17615 [Myxococcota bacterium]
MTRLFVPVLVAAVWLASACGGGDGSGGSNGGAGALGGASNTGGSANAKGGATSGGSASGGSAQGGAVVVEGGAGGVDGSGGVPGTGGIENSGGSTAAGGTVGSGGITSGGGSVASGGNTTAGGSVGSGGTTTDPGTGGVGEAGSGGEPPTRFVVSAQQNLLAFQTCSTPALISDVPAGTYTIELSESTLSKGYVSDDNNVESPSIDNYVIVSVPLPAGDPNEDMRVFMLHGVGHSVNITLPEQATISLLFIDSDTASNVGEAKVTLTPSGSSATVSAVSNVLAWRSACASTPVEISVANHKQRITLLESTFSTGTGAADPYVLLRLPSERPDDEWRYAVLNGIDSSVDFIPYFNGKLRAWLISPNAGATGEATLEISDIAEGP